MHLHGFCTTFSSLHLHASKNTILKIGLFLFVYLFQVDLTLLCELGYEKKDLYIDIMLTLPWSLWGLPLSWFPCLSTEEERPLAPVSPPNPVCWPSVHLDPKERFSSHT